MPIEKEIMDKERRIQTVLIDGIQVCRARDLGRELIIIEGSDPTGMADTFKKIVTESRKVFDTDIEPMMNVIGSYEGQIWRLLVFPRLKHRPDAFFEQGDDTQITVSPAVIEMGGVLVTPVEKDFERLSASAVEDIFHEVSPKGEIVEGLVDAIKGSRHKSML